MVGGDDNGAISNNPLFAPPTKEVKKIEIKRIVEGFEFGSRDIDIDSAASVENNGNDGNDGNNDLHNAYVDSHSNNKKQKK